jgi:hypothetical protein
VSPAVTWLRVLFLKLTFVSLFPQLQERVTCCVPYQTYSLNIILLQFALPVTQVSVLCVAAHADLINNQRVILGMLYHSVVVIDANQCLALKLLYRLSSERRVWLK